MPFKSNRNPQFRSKFSEDIFNHKYAHENCDTWNDLARILVEDVCQEYMRKSEKEELINIISNLSLFLVDDTYTTQDAPINSLTIAIFSKQRKIHEKIGQTSHGKLSPA